MRVRHTLAAAALVAVAGAAVVPFAVARTGASPIEKRVGALEKQVASLKSQLAAAQSDAAAAKSAAGLTKPGLACLALITADTLKILNANLGNVVYTDTDVCKPINVNRPVAGNSPLDAYKAYLAWVK